MPSDCSENHRTSRRAAGRHLRSLPLLLLALLIAPPAAEARRSGSWVLGSFPVVRFEGFTSPFGMRIHPLHGGLRPHHGLDIAAPLHSPIRSWWSGKVTDVINDGGCGVGLVIRSGDYEHIYCHLGGAAGADSYRSQGVHLRVGQRVRSGEVIGHIGLTGSTTGPHLHWGLRHRGSWVDPARVLRAMAAARRIGSPNPRWTPSVGYYR